MANWNAPEKHETTPTFSGDRVDFARRLDEAQYNATLAWAGKASFQRRGPHDFALNVDGDRLEFTCEFSTSPITAPTPSVDETIRAAAEKWQQFWSEGGAIDLGNCTDARAPELERRIILSQYNTALHCAGSLPSAETGLLFNSWYGKFHLEMHWWHSAHFTSWNRFAMFERSLALYQRILPIAQEIAKRQGYAGRAGQR